MIMAPGVVHADDLSTAWRDTLTMVADHPTGKMSHVITTIQDAQAEIPAIRAQADRLLQARRRPSIETVANTIFPIQMATTSTSPDQLTARYRAAYPAIKRFHGNRSGTYFGRLVDHPDSRSRPGDQIARLITKLQSEITTGKPMGARYEIAVRSANDNGRRGFPCMSSCSFQLDHDCLHLLAIYRYEYLVEKGYGNYLGLARLLAYVAGEAELLAGKLTIMCGLVQADAPRASLSTHLGLSRRRPAAVST